MRNAPAISASASAKPGHIRIDLVTPPSLKRKRSLFAYASGSDSARSAITSAWKLLTDAMRPVLFASRR